MSDHACDVAVVGGGVVGAAAAHALASRGARVALVERGRVGQGTTSHSFAWINATSKVSDEAYHRLNALGARLWRELGDKYGDAALGLRRSGMLQCVRRSDEAGLAAMREQAARLAAFGHGGRLADRAELVGLAPSIAFAADDEGLVAETDDWIDAPRAARLLADRVVATGGAVLEDCPALALELGASGEVTGVATGHGAIAAPQVLLAAGPDTPGVLAALTGYEAFATRFPMRRVPGLLLDTPPRPAALGLRHVVYVERPAGEIHLRPTPEGGLRLGSDLVDGLVAEESNAEEIAAAAARLLDLARACAPALVDGLDARDCRAHIGVRPYPEDGRTIAGPVPGASGLHLVCTHSGVTLAPALAQLMSERIVDGTKPDTLVPFGLERLPGFA